MMDKKLMELLEALARDSKNALPPYKELELLGFDTLGNELGRKETEECSGEKRRMVKNIFWTVTYTFPNSYNKEYWNKVEYYEFDENDHRYAILLKVLKTNNDRRKYFA